MGKFHLIFMLDRSGSMSGLEEDTIGGYNGFLEKYHHLPNTKVTTVLFDHSFELLHDGKCIKEAMLTKNNYSVRGTTAMLDAIGHTVKYLRNKTPFFEKKEQFIYIITTDGMENASTNYTYKDIHQLISNEQELGHEFVFLGANIDTYQEASKLGIKKEFARNFEASNEGTRDMYQQMDMMVDSLVKKI